MKNKKFLSLFLTLIIVVLIITVGNVQAEESNNQSSNIQEENTSRWKTEQPEKIVTSESVTDEYNIQYEASWYFEGTVTVTVTIPENYDKDKIVIAPRIFETLAEKLYKEEYNYDTENMIFSNPFQAGDQIKLNIVINNLSKFTYNYDETSFEIFPKEDIVYQEVEENIQEEKTELFNGLTVNDKYHFSRTYNTALKALLPNANKNTITDEAIDNALKTKGYNGMSDYGKYLLDFYNNKYGTNYTNLDNFPDGVIREILNENNPYLLSNSAYSALRIYPDRRDTEQYVLTQINNKADKQYNSLEEYIVEFYNNKYNTSATKLVELSKEALDEFFSTQGMESGGRYILESDPDVLALSYNYFYNKGLAFGFEDDVQGKSLSQLSDESEDYSIGEYMRDKSKGDAGIIKNAKTLDPNSIKSINNALLYTSGNYITNSYINYEFMVDMHFTYSAPKGTVIAKYVDVDGNVLAEDIITKDMVGKDYQTNAQTFDGYTLYTIDGIEKGQYINGEIVVIYVYNKTKEEEIEEPKIVKTSIVYDQTPQTGDTSNMNIWIMLLLISLFGIVITNKKCQE